MALSPRHIALQGLTIPPALRPRLVAVQGLAAVDVGPVPAGQGGAFSDRPWRDVPFLPVPAGRRRRRRQQDIIFLGD